MKARNKTELIDTLGNIKQERKRELFTLSSELKAAKYPNDLPLVRRAAIIFSYAHWEGFIKDASQAYVIFVASKSRKLSDLIINFQALACRQELIIAQKATKRIFPHLIVVKRLTDEINESYSLNPSTSIDTESNLTSEIFENICNCIGIDYKLNWEVQGPFIDDLFRNRCAIAHGELYVPDMKYSIEALEFSIKAIDQFSTEVENAVELDAYLRTNIR